MENIFVQMHLVTMKALSPQIYNGLQIFLVIKGSIRIDVNSNKYTLKNNELILLNCNDIYSIEGGESNIVLILKIPFEYMQKECEDMLRYTFTCYSGERDPENNQKYDEIRRILIHMMIAYSNLREGHKLDIRANLFQLLHYLLINFKSAELDESAISSKKKDRRISSILVYINENYRQNITLEALAKREFISVHYLSKLFKSQLGIGFLDYINQKRLESGMKDLLYTNQSIIKIALLNGFANAKSFTNSFKKQYNVTPNKFKQSYQRAESVDVCAEYEQLAVNELEGFPDLVKYIQFYDNSYEESVKANILYQTVLMDAENNISTPLKNLKKILRIGKWSDALKLETQNQLNFAQKKLKCHYIHFQGIFCDGVFQYGESSIYNYYDYNQTISYFKSIDLIPFIRINLTDVIKSNQTVDEACDVLTLFLTTMSKYFSKTYVEEWLFEISHYEEINESEYLLYYQKLYQRFKQFSARINVGLFSVTQNSEQELNAFRRKLLVCIKNNCVPDLITLKAEPNMKSDSMGMLVDSYKSLKGYHVRIVESLQKIISDCGLPKIPLYATEWNTIAGKSILEVRSFYRAALIVETMLDMSEHISGLSFWLNEQISEQMVGVRHCILSLFHCFTAKRPAFFTLQALTRLGSSTLYRDENIVATKNKQGDYVIMVSNPCYLNPQHSMDYNFICLHQKKLIVELKNLESGLYRFKMFNFKMNFSFAINSMNAVHGLSDIHSYKYNDEDMLEHIENIASPEFAVYEENIKESCTLKPDLSFNAVILYIIRKL